MKLFVLKQSDLDGRNFGLDLARAIAIALVVLAHCRSLLPEFENRNLFANGGYFGVELFFVLSGFLIGGILIKSIEKNDVFGFKLIGKFWIRRWFRTIPNYMLFLILNMTAFQYLFGKKTYDYSYFFFMQNFMWPAPSLMPESWSLSVEEWFYISLPLTILLFSVLSLSKKNLILTSAICYIAVFTLFRFYEVIVNDPSWGPGIRRVVLFRLDSIGYGVLMAYMAFYRERFMLKHTRFMLSVGIGLLIPSVVLYSHYAVTASETLFNKTLLFSVTNIGLALCLPWFKGLACRRQFAVKIITYTSIASYSMYLVHWSFALPLVTTFLAPHAPWPVAVSVYFALTTGLSILIYKYFERPMTRLRDRF